jgi:hypothetical protein
MPLRVRQEIAAYFQSRFHQQDLVRSAGGWPVTVAV